MPAVKITITQPDDDGEVMATFSAAPGSGHAYSFAPAGKLVMGAEVWAAFQAALQKGARRPLVVFLEETPPGI